MIDAQEKSRLKGSAMQQRYRVLDLFLAMAMLLTSAPLTAAQETSAPAGVPVHMW